MKFHKIYKIFPKFLARVRVTFPPFFFLVIPQELVQLVTVLYEAVFVFQRMASPSSQFVNRKKYAIADWDDFTLSVMPTSQIKFVDETGLQVQKNWPGYGICCGTIREQNGKSCSI